MDWNKLRRDPWGVKRIHTDHPPAWWSKITASKMEPNNKKEVVRNEEIDEETH